MNTTASRILSLAACLALACLVFAPSGAAGEPAWNYPIPPDILANKEGYLTLTNRDHLLPSDYEPNDLVVLSVRKTDRGTKLRKAVSEALEVMFGAAQDESGYTLYVKSGYRAYQTQKTMYFNRLESMGYDDGLVQYPGASEHQTGLCADILNYKWTQKDGMNYRFAEEDEAKWMAEHCWEYGFIVRYELDKEEITGIKFEPWHLRYVGRECARYIWENHLSLEEFTEEWQAYIASYEAAGGDFDALVRKMNLPNKVIVLEIREDGEEEISAFY